jgi:hypothetical protein
MILWLAGGEISVLDFNSANFLLFALCDIMRLQVMQLQSVTAIAQMTITNKRITVFASSVM